MPQFPNNDEQWEGVRQFLSQQSKPHSLILAPEPFVVTARSIITYESIAEFHPASFDHVLIHKGLTQYICQRGICYVYQANAIIV